MEAKQPEHQAGALQDALAMHDGLPAARTAALVAVALDRKVDIVSAFNHRLDAGTHKINEWRYHAAAGGSCGALLALGARTSDSVQKSPATMPRTEHHH